MLPFLRPYSMSRWVNSGPVMLIPEPIQSRVMFATSWLDRPTPSRPAAWRSSAAKVDRRRRASAGSVTDSRYQLRSPSVLVFHQFVAINWDWNCPADIGLSGSTALASRLAISGMPSSPSSAG